MNILFAAMENSWGGFLQMIRSELPQHNFRATGGFNLENLKGFDVLIPTMSLVTKDVIETGDRLKLIQQCGSGIELVDLEAARKKKIWVANVPTSISGNADSVAELGIYMIIGLSRDVGKMAKSIKKGKMGEPQGRALRGQTVGIIGLGGIGRALVKRLKPFDVNLIGIKRTDIDKTRDELKMDWVGASDDIHFLLKKSDIVVLCLPCNDESVNLINRETLSCMKEDAFLINLSRGGLIDYGALKDALSSGKIAGAGLDVFWEEPPDPDDPIFQYNILATPHIAGSTDVSIQGIVHAVAENIRRLEKNLKPLYIQN